MPSRSFKIGILLFGSALIMACSLIGASPTPVATLVFSTRTPQAQAQTNPEVPAATPTQIPSDTPLPSTDISATPTRVPTLIPPTPRPANPTLQFDSALNAYRVEFGAGGTWAQFNGTLDDSGQSVRYVLSAMQGQVMSISIVESWPFYVDVENSGNVIGNAAADHPFWRGTLPTSGNYFITVKTQMPGNYTLRITINPPGQAHQTFNTQHSRFTLKYSDEFSPTTYIPVGEFKGTPNMVLNFINSDFYGPITNLGEAYLMVNIVSDTGTCLQISRPGEAFLGEKTFNGKTFTESQFVDAAAGNIYEQLFYRAVLNNTCYEIVFFMHSSNIGNYTPGTVVEFDRLALLQKFKEVLATFDVN